MSSSTNKRTTFFIFLLTAGAGIAMFISAWNSFITGKEKIYISLAFLILFISGLSILFYEFNRLYLIKQDADTSDIKVLPGGDEEGKRIMDEITGNKDVSFSLLNGVFSKPDVKNIGEKLLKNLAREYEIVQGIFFVLNSESSKFTMAASYALTYDTLPPDFLPGEGIAGQAVADNKIIIIPNIPESYSPVISGLGKAKARYLYVIPVIFESKSIAVIEISCFKEIEEDRLPQLSQLMREGGLKLNPVLSREVL